MVSFLMIGNLILGLIAWIIPVISIMKIKKGKNESCSVLSFFSTILCAISLYFQIYYNYYLVKIWDASALMDTMGTSSFLSAIMLVVTIILNVINLHMFNKRKIVSLK